MLEQGFKDTENPNMIIENGLILDLDNKEPEHVKALLSPSDTMYKNYFN